MLSVIIPVKNEARSIADIVRRVKGLTMVDEVIVVNDGSSDATGNICL